jgi:uncharacterized protein involved in propanediol utilization
MDENELKDALFDGYLFGIRLLMQAHNIKIPAKECDKQWELLQGIAKGEFTLVESPSDQFSKFPQMKEELNNYQRNISRFIQNDKDIAKKIIEKMQELTTNMGN